jgi:hypothetical protein
MNNSHDKQLPDDLQVVAARLHAGRAEATPLELDQLKQRSMAQHRRRAKQSFNPFGKDIPMRKRALALGLSLLLIGGTGAGAIAGNGGNSGNNNASCAQYKPGNGFGDKNHVHTGPPGQTGFNPCGNGH